MTFLADEGVDRQIVDRLRLDGYQVAYVAEMSPGIADEAVLAQGRNSASVLITADKDFGELIFRNRQLATGVILIRLMGLSSGTKATLVSTAIREHAEEIARRVFGFNRWNHSHPSQITHLETIALRGPGCGAR